ncbi:MAG: OmpA family protein, partial [Psychromonas sp.]|nr:OmpA family protein [Psychromonas sp.]
MRVRPRTRLQMHSGNDLHRWTVSLADFMTLMFAVFVVLYAVSVSNEEKYKDVMLSIQNASKLLNHSVFSSEHAGILTKESNSIIEDGGPAILTDKSAMQDADEHSDVQAVNSGRELSELKFKLVTALASELDDDSIRLQLDGDWLTIEMDGNLLFVGGSHTLLTSAKKKIKKLAVLLKPINNRLKIRGYTDQEPISNEIYRSNWELAGARAFAVLHELNRFGIAGKRMVMEAYGQYSPVVDKNGNIDKLKSRRVVIAVSKYAVV